MNGWRAAGSKSCRTPVRASTWAVITSPPTKHGWQRLDYQPLGNKPMQSVRASHQPHYQAQPSTERHLHDAQPLDIALLHNEKARISKPNPVREHPLALALAQSLWDAQQAQQPALQALFSGFERIWVHERGQHQQTHITQTWTQFLANSSHSCHGSATSSVPGKTPVAASARRTCWCTTGM